MGKDFFTILRDRQTKEQRKILRSAPTLRQLAIQLSESAHSLAADFWENSEDAAEIDCQQGCAHCCYQPVTVFPFEAIHIASVLQKKLSETEVSLLKQKLQLRINAFNGGALRTQLNNKTACPLLVDQVCSVYEQRPLTCRLAHSFSVKKCRQSFEKDRMKVQVPLSVELVQGVSGVIEGVFENLPHSGFDANLYELCSILLVALSDTNAATRWAERSPGVFKNCIRDDT